MKTIKMIKFDKCKDCPLTVSFRDQYWCRELNKKVDSSTLDKDCKLMNYPKTITEFNQGKI